MPQEFTEATVGQLVVERPARARVFERFGIDYCCGGKKPLAQACREKGVETQVVLRELTALDGAQGTERDWAAASLTELADHIVATHHDWLKREMPRLLQLAQKVARVHGEDHPELVEVWQIVRRLKSELESHTLREEQILFPAIWSLEGAPAQGERCFGSLRNPISVMTSEHDDAGEALAALRRLTNDYTPPASACGSYRALLSGLAELESDMHQHVHKENNILFPRAIAAEAGRA